MNRLAFRGRSGFWLGVIIIVGVSVVIVMVVWA
jgi:hypothetical protein